MGVKYEKDNNGFVDVSIITINHFGRLFYS